MKLAFVTPRYGRDVVGGAETLVRQFAEQLVARGHAIRVLTSCARDHFSWRNEHPAGTTLEQGVQVERYPVTRAKDNQVMHRYEVSLAAGLSLPANAEREWVANTGYSEPLLDAIGTAADTVDALVFAPYLFASTVFGASIRPERSIVVPCLHDEAYARFEPVRTTLRSVAGLIFNSDAERDLASSLLGRLPAHATVGVGFDAPAALDPSGFRGRHGVPGDFVAYAGRREAGKNFPLLLECLATADALRESGEPVDLVVMGSGEYELPAVAAPRVCDVGYVTHEEKLNGFAAATAVSNLSVNESFSYVIMESWLAGAPVIVHRDCAVTREHCERSGGGVWVASPEQWSEAVIRLRSDAGLRRHLAERGRRYVDSHYSWQSVLARFESAVTEIMA